MSYAAIMDFEYCFGIGRRASGHESVAMVMEAGLWNVKSSLIERSRWMEKSGGKAAGRVLKTRVRGRA